MSPKSVLVFTLLSISCFYHYRIRPVIGGCVMEDGREVPYIYARQETDS